MKEKTQKRVGEILYELKALSKERIETVLREQDFQLSQEKRKFGEIALELDFITEAELAKALAIQTDREFVSLKNLKLDKQVAKKIPADAAKRYKILPLGYKGKELIIGTGDPTRVGLEDFVARYLKTDNFRIVSVEPSVLFLRQYEVLEDLSLSEQIGLLGNKLVKESELSGGRSPEIGKLIPKFVKTLFLFALVQQATDVHFVSDKKMFRIFFRVSSELRHYYSFPAILFDKVSAFIKTEAGLEPGDRLHFQDGSLNFSIGPKTIDMRLSISPVVPVDGGESMVMRILDKTRISLDLKSLGFFDGDAEKIVKAAHLPYGLILVTGPTGSGKTTTLYASLLTRDPFSDNIITIENPVEYQMPGIRQVQVNEKSGITFVSALRTFLRQDPDVILVGEIRDAETAETAFYSAMTGHIVFSTLHTNDACSVIPRLLEFDLDPSLITSSLSLIIAQRLVRKVCDRCKSFRAPTEFEAATFKKAFGKTPKQIAYGKGCEKCRNSGYYGVTNIYEFLEVTDDLKSYFRPGVSALEVRKAAKKQGFQSLFHCGLKKVLKKQTTVEEVLRVAKL